MQTAAKQDQAEQAHNAQQADGQEKAQQKTGTWPALVVRMGEAVEMRPSEFWNTVKATCGMREAPNEAVMAFLLTAKKYDLDPMVKQVYAFEKNGKIVPIVPIDGWLKIINDHPQYDGMEFIDTFGEDGKIVSITCILHRKDRKVATPVTEYLAECAMNTDPWKKWPIRMLRHKATIQAGRYAFSLSGIFDPDEGKRIIDSMESTPEDIKRSVDSHLADVGMPQNQPPAQPQTKLNEQVIEGEFTDAKNDAVEEPVHQEPSDWNAVLDELLPGLNQCKTPIEFKVFLEENGERIDTLSAAPPTILSKWLMAVDAKNKQISPKKAAK